MKHIVQANTKDEEEDKIVKEVKEMETQINH